jgi:hypothetical protein
LDHRPIEWHKLARIFLERVTKSGDRLFELHRPTFALAEPHEGAAEIVLGDGPIVWHAVARETL